MSRVSDDEASIMNAPSPPVTVDLPEARFDTDTASMGLPSAERTFPVTLRDCPMASEAVIPTTSNHAKRWIDLNVFI